MRCFFEGWDAGRASACPRRRGRVARIDRWSRLTVCQQQLQAPRGRGIGASVPASTCARAARSGLTAGGGGQAGACSAGAPCGSSRVWRTGRRPALPPSHAHTLSGLLHLGPLGPAPVANRRRDVQHFVHLEHELALQRLLVERLHRVAHTPRPTCERAGSGGWERRSRCSCAQLCTHAHARPVPRRERAGAPWRLGATLVRL